MDIYERIKLAAASKGYSINRLEQELGFPRSSIAKFKTNNPSTDKIVKIADLLGVSVDSLAREDCATYYLNDETAEIAQAVFDDPDLRLLFQASRDCRPENIRLAAEMLRRLKETNPNG